MEKTKSTKTPSKITLLIIIILALIGADIIFLIFAASESRTTALLKNELVSLEQDKRIISSANEISRTYQQEIAVISNVFPNEETLPTFIEKQENLLKTHTDSYSVKFNSVTPLKEQERLYLPLTLTLHTDSARLILLLTQMEKLDYMMHVTSIVTKTPNGFTKTGECTLVTKLYVQKPFSAK